MKLLVITSRFPYPIEKGDKLRAFHQMRVLSKRHEVTLVALTDQDVAPADLAEVEAVCDRLHVIRRSRLTTILGVLRAGLTGVPLQVGYFQSRAASDEIASIIADEQPDHVYCQLIRTAPFGRGLQLPTTIDYQDAFSAATRRSAGQASFGVRWLLGRESKRISRYEASASTWFDHSVIISEQDRESLDFPGSERVVVLPNGVDTDHFSPDFAAEVSGGPVRDISFIGNMGYPPNVDAVGSLVNEIMPLVHRRLPGTDLLIAGARPSRSVRNLAGPLVEVSGWVDDIRTAYRSGRVMVAPLFIGAGQQNKILEAMAMGVPCVTTELVNSAIGAEPGREVFIASTPQEFADHAVALLEDPELHAEVASAALGFVRANYSWDSVGEQLEAVFRAPT